VALFRNARQVVIDDTEISHINNLADARWHFVGDFLAFATKLANSTPHTPFLLGWVKDYHFLPYR
jgi:hypothetical protein